MLTQKEKDWLLRIKSYIQENQDCRIESITDRSGLKSIQIIFPHGKGIKENLDTGRNNFNNKQRRIFNRLIEAVYFVIFMEKAIPGITLTARDLALERLKADKLIKEVKSYET